MSCKKCGVGDKENENDDKFRSFVQNNSCQSCPACKFYVHKIDGCRHITCLCKNQFCYDCGKNLDVCLCKDDEIEDDMHWGLFE